MIILALLLGLLLGVALNRVIARQLHEDIVHAPATTFLHWLPIGGALIRRAWLELAVEVLTVGMTVVLWSYYGWSLRFALLLAATLVLIDTGAIDWQVKLIDTLVMVVATLLVVALAPWIITSRMNSWQSSLLGLLAAGLVFAFFFVMAKVLYPTQKAPFGLGDVYLGMFIGALLGFFRVGPALFYGMLLAGLVSFAMIAALGLKRARHIPISYGTFLCLGVLLYLVINRL